MVEIVIDLHRPLTKDDERRIYNVSRKIAEATGKAYHYRVDDGVMVISSNKITAQDAANIAREHDV